MWVVGLRVKAGFSLSDFSFDVQGVRCQARGAPRVPRVDPVPVVVGSKMFKMYAGSVQIFKVFQSPPTIA